MSSLFRTSIFLLSVVALPSIASACIWDYDTLKQERARFPDTLEIITGKFLRHSKEFYEWRIQDRLKRIAVEPKNANLYDDLAVAYSKTGQNAKAIKTMLKVEEFAPKRYETYANLSVFYFVAGDLTKALDYVNKALAINPDAHFGREKYQKWLTEYVMERSKDGKFTLPLKVLWTENDLIEENKPRAFSEYLQFKLHGTEEKRLAKEDCQAAVKGVLGMMRFADCQSPLLLEVLGDLLMGHGRGNQRMQYSIDAKRLATRAYLQASYQSSDDVAKKRYRQIAQDSLSMQSRIPNKIEPLGFDELEREFQVELSDANKWYSDVKSQEISWIRDGANPEEEFDKLYAADPRAAGEIAENDSYQTPRIPSRFEQFKGAFLIGAGALALILLIYIGRWLRGSSAPTANTPTTP